MTDTIEMLETIGSDASLRYASVHELSEVLVRAQASAELAMAVSSGDNSPLRRMMRGQDGLPFQVMTTHAITYMDAA